VTDDNPVAVISTTPRTLTLSRRESRSPPGARRACRTRTGTSPAIMIRRGRHHLPQAAEPPAAVQLFSRMPAQSGDSFRD
jgi:hypothetical protein